MGLASRSLAGSVGLLALGALRSVLALTAAGRLLIPKRMSLVSALPSPMAAAQGVRCIVAPIRGVGSSVRTLNTPSAVSTL